MKVERGVRKNLDATSIKVTLKIDGAATYDFSCFGVDGANKLSDDRYMIFIIRHNRRAVKFVTMNFQTAQNFSSTLKLCRARFKN